MSIEDRPISRRLSEVELHNNPVEHRGHRDGVHEWRMHLLHSVRVNVVSVKYLLDIPRLPRQPNGQNEVPHRRLPIPDNGLAEWGERRRSRCY